MNSSHLVTRPRRRRVLASTLVPLALTVLATPVASAPASPATAIQSQSEALLPTYPILCRVLPILPVCRT